MFCGDDWLVCSTSSHVACGSCACDLVGGKKKLIIKLLVYMLNFSMVDVSPFSFYF